MQLAYQPERAQNGTRAAKWINPKQGEMLIGTRDEAFKHIASIEKTLQGQMPRFKRAEWLIARAMIYEALGDRRMLHAAEDAWKQTKTAVTAHLMAVAYHHFGNLAEAVKYYKQAYAYPHEEGFNIDLAYTQALLFEGSASWPAAHKMTLGLKKRMVYAAYLPEWDGKAKEVSIVSEGGFGDIIHTGRYIPVLTEMGVKSTVYLPPYFFEHGFVDLMRRQPWCPEVKLLTETPQTVPAVGFFDLPAVFNSLPETIPPSLTFEADPERVAYYKNYLSLPGGLPRIGFCYGARAMETPLTEAGTYRSLTLEQANRIICSTLDAVHFVNLQKDGGIDDLYAPLTRPIIKSWEDTAAIIANLDAVVTVDTAVAHLAAAMKKPVYLLLSGASDWKFGMSGTTTPWYPTMKIFRNDDFGFERAVTNLISFLNETYERPAI